MAGDTTSTAAPAPRPISAWTVFAVTLRLGLTSFGGPVAHLGYYREEYVKRRQWLDEATFADLVALCQFLPGPASSQVTMAVGLMRAGYLGMLAAWTGFTMPSAIAMVLFAYGVEEVGGALNSGWLHGLKVVAVAVVAQAVLGMMRSLAPDRPRATLAVVAAAIVLSFPTAFGQIGAILFGALVGAVLLKNGNTQRQPSEPADRGQPLDRRGPACVVPGAAGRTAARWRQPCRARASTLPPPSTAPARWCSAAAMWCCRCCRPRWCRRAG